MANISKMMADLKDLEESLDELPEEFRDDIREEIKILKEEISMAKKEESAKDKMKQEAEKKIEKLEKVVESPKTQPKVKQQVKKSIASVKKQAKEAVKEDEKERKAKYEARAKKKVAAVKSGAKRGRPKKVEKAVKKVVKKRVSKAEIKYTKALRSLNALVNKTAELKAKYKGKGVDLEKDALRKAKPFGYRLRGNNYRRPTKAEIKSGDAYWEGRPNRADVKRSTYPKLEDGGMMAKGGFNPMKNSYLLYEGQSILLKTVPSPKERRFLDKEIVIEKIDNNKILKAFVRETGEKVPFLIDSNLFKIEQYADGGMIYLISDDGYEVDISQTDLSKETRNFFKKSMTQQEIKKLGTSKYNSFIHYLDKKGYKKRADGGMMAKGGRTKKRTKAQIIADQRLKAKKPGKRVAESGEVYYESRENRADVNRKLRLEDGGMMKKGGRTKASIIADKRYKALKAGKRVSASGEVYYESRANRSDVSRRDRI